MSHIRHLAAVFRWPVIGALAVGTIALGIVGFMAQADLTGTDRTLFEATYRTMQLFVLEWGGMEHPMPAALEVARFAAPLVSGLAAAKTIAVIFREEIERLWVRAFGRGHVVVCGQGDAGWRLAAALRRGGWRVAAVEVADPIRPVTAWALIQGDATDPHTLRRAATRRARHVVALTGDDGTNIAVARAAMSFGVARLTIHVLTSRPELAAMLRAETLGSHAGSSPVLEFFTFEERGSRILLDSLEQPPQVVVAVGSSALADRVAGDVTRRWPEARVDRCRCDEVAHRVVGRRSLVLVSDAPPADALTDALAIVQSLRAASFGTDGGTTDVFALSPSARNLGGLVASDPSAAIRLHAFDLLEMVLTPALVVSGARESIARAVHEAYRQTTPIGASPLPAWDELDDAHRAASRAAADGVAQLLRSVGCDLVAATPDDSTTLTLLPSEVELMAVLEHDRWLAWTASLPDLPDNENRVDWFQLPPSVRRRTENVVRRLPAALGDVGQRVVRLERSPARDLHEAYVARRTALGETVDTNPSLVAWDRLPVSLQDSNRDQVAHLRVKLRSIGLDLVEGPGPGVDLTGDQIERLSEMEHDRWVRHRAFDGWIAGDTKDPERKVTPYLVPWDDLDEATRETDRAFVRSIPSIAESLGCHVGPRA